MPQSFSTIAENPQVPSRGPTPYHGRGQYYDVLNHYFKDGVFGRHFASFKRTGDKQGWGAPEWKQGLVVDRQKFLEVWKLYQVGARNDELVDDGCEILSFKKDPAPGDMVSYMLCSWPTNRELEKNRSTRVARKQPKQSAMPRDVTPFRRPQPYHTAEVAGEHERTSTRHEAATRFEMEFQAKPRPSTTPSTTQATIDLPLFPGKGQP